MSTISYILIQSCRIGYIFISQQNYNPMSNHWWLYFFGNDIQYDINWVAVVHSTRMQEKWYLSNRNNDEKQVGDQKQSLKKHTKNWGAGDVCISSPIHRIPPLSPTIIIGVVDAAGCKVIKEKYGGLELQMHLEFSAHHCLGIGVCLCLWAFSSQYAVLYWQCVVAA